MRTERNAILRRNPSEQENLSEMLAELRYRIMSLETQMTNLYANCIDIKPKKSKS